MSVALYVRKLREGLEALEGEIEQRTRQLATLHQHATQLREMVAAFEGEDVGPVSGVDTGRMNVPPRQPPTKSVRNGLADLLRESGGPLHSRHLLDLLRDRGIIVGGQDPAAAVRSHLSHDPRFVSVGSGLWDLVSRRNRTMHTQPNGTTPERVSATQHPAALFYHSTGNRPAEDRNVLPMQLSPLIEQSEANEDEVAP